MSAPPDAMTQLLQGLLGGDQSSAPQGGLMAAINQALAPYGGSSQVALQLLGNTSGGSSPMSVLGQSLLKSQQASMDNQGKRMQLAQQALQMPAALYKAKLMQQMQGGPGTTLGGIQPVAAQGQQPAQPGQAAATPQAAPQQGAPGSPLGMPGNPFSQSAQQSNLPVPQERQAPPDPTAFDVPQTDLGEIPVNGMSPQQATAAQQVLGKDIDPVAAAEGTRKAQLQVAQSAVAPKINALDSIIKSDKPTQYVAASPQLAQLWKQIAPTLGMDPVQGFTDSNVRMALGIRRNQLASWAQLPAADTPLQDTTTNGPLGSIYQTNPVTKKTTQVKGEEGLKQVIGTDGQPQWVTDSQAVGMKPFNASVFGASNISGDAIQLAADTYRTTGKMPAGFARSPALQAKVLDQVAQDAKTSGDTVGAIAARSASLKANGQALDQVTKLQTATSGYAATLDKNLTNLEQSYSKVDSTGSPLVNRAVRIWQQGGTGDNQTADMVVWLNAVQGEYAKLKSGNLGNAPASDASMKDAKEVINKYLNQGGIKAVASAMRAESQNRLQAINEQKTALSGSLSTNAPTAPVQPGQSQTINGFTVTRVK